MRVVVLRKNSLLLLVVTLVPVLCLWTISGSNLVHLVAGDGYKTVKQVTEDTNNDGIKETINVRADLRKKTYWVEVLHEGGKTYVLKPDPAIGWLGIYEEWYPLNITVLDVNRDHRAEILVLGSHSHEKPFHLFRWNPEKQRYDRLFSQVVTGLDLHDVNGDQVPELIVVQRIYGTGYEYLAYQWQKNRYKVINYSLDAGTRGFAEISLLLEYLEHPFGGKPVLPREIQDAIFTERWKGSPRETRRLCKKFENTVSIQILNYIGEDLEWGQHQLPKQNTWRFQLLLFRKQGVSLKHEVVEAEFRTKLVNPQTGAYRIDRITFR